MILLVKIQKNKLQLLSSKKHFRNLQISMIYYPVSSGKISFTIICNLFSSLPPLGIRLQNFRAILLLAFFFLQSCSENFRALSYNR